MTFSTIVRKNFLYNAKKYLSLYFVNSLTVAILFMFGSLLYNPEVLMQVGDTTLYGIVRFALVGVVLFSFVFITYSNLSFLKYRSKEFGMYITLGMTTKNLIKMLFLENVGIFAVSLASGLVTGGVFGKLFFMGLNQILISKPISFELNGSSLLLSSGIFLIVFSGNFIFNILYLRKISIVDVLQAAKKKEIGKSSVVMGSLAMIVFAASVLLLPQLMLGKLFDEATLIIIILIVLTMVTPYVIFGTLISVVKSVMKHFKKIYNNNLIVMSNLSHRFLSYKTTMYIVSLLMAGALFFIGMTYAMYATTDENNDRDHPFDVMFVESNRFNQMDDGEIESILTKQGSTVEQNETLEILQIPEFRNYGGSWVLWDTHAAIISEGNYNRHMGTSYSLSPSQALFARVHQENREYAVPDNVLAVMDPELISEELREKGSKDDLLRALEGYPVTEYKSGSIKVVSEPYINSVQTANSYFGHALVVDDMKYEKIKAAVEESQVIKAHLVKGDIREAGFQALVQALRERNGFDSSYWNSTQQQEYLTDDERTPLEALRPIYKDEQLKNQLESNGTIFFIIIFLGSLFAIDSGVVLYHKVLSDIDDHKDSLLSLKRIGVTRKEIIVIVSKELAVTFFLPSIFGVGLGLYYFNVLFSNQNLVGQLVEKAALVASLFLVLQVVFYFVSRKKYVSELGKYL
ncbi:FtsX-like permease family protein [Paenibacillus sp. Marseille-P2973]|uniref:ABC transporter permease n=1 Tax=Paenibacillus sp. Marseille-P2973 TaxID=1871032 RepID=UPI001B398868|nr:ABC transporter permease [Paenibacillus sp. Marseille-P2973]MBQ4898300.1 FtsX-like permease family protein [Paenibacillus sp. Marseille-P2973]